MIHLDFPYKLFDVVRTTKLNMPPEQQQKCIQEYKSSYVLKVCGYNEFLLANAPMIQYKVQPHSRQTCAAARDIQRALLQIYIKIMQSCHPLFFFFCSLKSMYYGSVLYLVWYFEFNFVVRSWHFV